MARSNLELTDQARREIIEDRYQMASDVMSPVNLLGEQSRYGSRGDIAPPGYRYQRHDGEKYQGGLGPIELLLTDYWSLRRRSATFFKTNPYARGIIRVLVGNYVNTGLTLAARPNADLLPVADDAADDWADRVNDMFESWGSLPEVCDYCKQNTFGQWQRAAKSEALINGDVLVIEHHNAATQLPYYELLDGQLVQNPFDAKNQIGGGNRVVEGVELNKAGEHVAFWIVQKDFKFKRIKARGENGRRIAWMYYGTDKRHNETRGEPLLSLVMQNISEIDRFRDSSQRKATLGSQIVAFLQRDAQSNTVGSKPFSSGAQRRVVESEEVGDGTERHINIAEQPYGLMIDGLNPGESINGFNNDTTNEKFGDFEKAILGGVAWALKIPYSVLAKKFDSSYSASRGEIKEFESVIAEERDRDADTLLRPIYRSWLRAMVLTRRIDAPGFLPAARDPMQFDVYAAWTRSEWYGMVKEAVDLAKETQGRKEQISIGALTHTRAARMLTGTDFKLNARRIQKENQMLADAIRPMLEIKKEFGEEIVDEVLRATSGQGSLSLIEQEGGNNASVAN